MLYVLLDTNSASRTKIPSSVPGFMLRTKLVQMDGWKFWGAKGDISKMAYHRVTALGHSALPYPCPSAYLVSL